MLNLLVLIFVFILVFIFFKYKEYSIIFLPLINVVADSTIGFFSGGIHLGDVRVFFILFFILYYFYKNGIKKDFVNAIVIFIIIYTIILIFINSSNYVYSSLYFLKVLISLLLFVIAKDFFRNIDQLKKLSKNIEIALIVQIFFIIIANIFKLGESQYVEGTFYEGMGGAPTVFMFFCLCFLPFIIALNDKKKKITMIKYLLFFIIGFVTIIIAMRRTTIFSMGVAVLLYGMLSKNKTKFVKLSVVFGFIIVLLWPVFQDRVMTIYNYRFVEKSKTIEEEGRVEESELVLNQVLEFNLQSFFGQEPYNSVSFNKKNYFKDRQFHTFHSILLHGTGIIGFLLFLLFFYSIYWSIRVARNRFQNDVFHKMYISCMILLVVNLIQITSFGIEMITSNSFVYICIGAFIGLSKNPNLLLSHKNESK